MTSTDPVFAVLKARAVHNGTVIHWGRDRYGWRCECGEGRSKPHEISDWDTAAGELRHHEATHIVRELERLGLLVPVINMSQAFVDVLIERTRQENLWGEQNHPNGTGPELPFFMPAEVTTRAQLAKWARTRCEEAFARGDGTWEHILTEEWAEALAEENPRVELVQVAAVAVNWAEATER